MDGYYSSNRRGRVLPILALHVASQYHRLGWKPPVTTGLLLANTLLYLRPGPLDRHLPTIDQVSFNSHLILKYGDLKRFFLSPFYHMDETHIFYNMLSLLWKGVQLETLMGSKEFALMVTALLGMSQGIMLGLAKSLLLFFDYETPYYRQYAVGFSGVLFGMKVVLNSVSDGSTNVYGVEVPSSHAAWAELILIQMFVPESSFLGHLSGILAGLLYLWLRNSLAGPNPLTVLLRKFTGIATWPLQFVQRWFLPWRLGASGRGRRVGGSRPPRGRHLSGVWRCPICTFDNSEFLDACEMCSTERYAREFTPVQSPNNSREPSLEEVRLRRLERLSR
ncbi:rhomboid-like protein 14, mitochondrial [Iris pallida]|uniref:Rhomboid-like protein 14, mitochondrial n=1 Tax=Iris pallida TaxID=29817 RepID=A0AAX6EXP3_IRIPA|nr:rhomboid-like protein 14, mitochondrial [Iris pallida]